MQKNEKALFKLIADEMENGSVDKGVWARAFSEADGVDSQTRARYIRYRMEELLALNDELTQTSAMSEEHSKQTQSPSSGESRQAEVKKSPVLELQALSNDVLYRAAVGDLNSEYYVEKFERFDEKGAGYTLSWNWSAFLFNVPWALYRKLYGWFFALLGVFVFAGILEKEGAKLAAGFIFWTVSIGFGFYANSIYYNRILGKISSFRATSSDDKAFVSQLREGGGVHLWAKYLAIAFWILGLVVIFFVVIQGKNNSSSKTAVVEPLSVVPATNSVGVRKDRNWFFYYVDEEKGIKHYYDTNSLVQDGNMASVDYLWDRGAKDSDGVSSAVIDLRVDCVNKTAFYAKFEKYSGNMGTGDLLSTSSPAEKFDVSKGIILKRLCY